MEFAILSRFLTSIMRLMRRASSKGEDELVSLEEELEEEELVSLDLLSLELTSLDLALGLGISLQINVDFSSSHSLASLIL